MGKGRRLLVLLAVMALVRAVSGQAAPAGKDALAAQYLNKTLYLKIPVTSESFKAVISGGRYRILSERGKSTLFPVGEKVRITDVDLGGREVKLKIQSLDQRRQAELRFVLSAQGDVFPAGDVAAVLGKFFTPGLSYADIDGAKRDYLEDQYNAFVEAESTAADLSAAAVNDAVVRVNPCRTGPRPGRSQPPGQGAGAGRGPRRPGKGKSLHLRPSDRPPAGKADPGFSRPRLPGAEPAAADRRDRPPQAAPAQRSGPRRHRPGHPRRRHRAGPECPARHAAGGTPAASVAVLSADVGRHQRLPGPGETT